MAPGAEDATPLVVVSVLDGLRSWAEAWPHEPLYIWLRAGEESSCLRFGELHARAGAVAAALLGRWGVARGDRVLLVFPPGLDFVVALLGCMRAGVIAVPVRVTLLLPARALRSRAARNPLAGVPS